jgi:hypothetical protein
VIGHGLSVTLHRQLQLQRLSIEQPDNAIAGRRGAPARVFSITEAAAILHVNRKKFAAPNLLGLQVF